MLMFEVDQPYGEVVAVAWHLNRDRFDSWPCGS